MSKPFFSNVREFHTQILWLFKIRVSSRFRNKDNMLQCVGKKCKHFSKQPCNMKQIHRQNLKTLLKYAEAQFYDAIHLI